MAVTVIAVLGPTAVGKSELSLALARELGGEVVNADSMQLYQGMDIGTAKLHPHERHGVPHHVLDIWPVTETASVAEYQWRARAAIDDILARGRVPLLVGGSGLYVRAVLERFEFPGTDADLRAALEAELAAQGPAALYERLRQRDPQAAARILPGNGRRIVRALEVVELTGSFTATLPGSTPHYASIQLGLDRDTAVLDERIALRVDRMWEHCLVEEVRELVARGLREGRTARSALGYQQALAYLDGECSAEQARAETVRATRRFVRRQRKWFRRDPHIHWLDAAAPDLTAQALALIARYAPAGGTPATARPAESSRVDLSAAPSGAMPAEAGSADKAARAALSARPGRAQSAEAARVGRPAEAGPADQVAGVALSALAGRVEPAEAARVGRPAEAGPADQVAGVALSALAGRAEPAEAAGVDRPA